MIDYKEKLKDIQSLGKGNIGEHLGIEYTDLGDGFISGKMPVDHRTKQPAGILHGGISVVLAETLGSVGTFLSLPNDKICVGLEINANHIKSVSSGFIHGKAICKHKGRSTQIWEINIVDDHNHLVCISRITLAILDNKVHPNP